MDIRSFFGQPKKKKKESSSSSPSNNVSSTTSKRGTKRKNTKEEEEEEVSYSRAIKKMPSKKGKTTSSSTSARTPPKKSNTSPPPSTLTTSSQLSKSSNKVSSQSSSTSHSIKSSQDSSFSSSRTLIKKKKKVIYDSDSTTDDEDYGATAGDTNEKETKKFNQVKKRKEVIQVEEESDSDRTTDGEEEFELKPTKKATKPSSTPSKSNPTKSTTSSTTTFPAKKKTIISNSAKLKSSKMNPSTSTNTTTTKKKDISATDFFASALSKPTNNNNTNSSNSASGGNKSNKKKSIMDWKEESDNDSMMDSDLDNDNIIVVEKKKSAPKMTTTSSTYFKDDKKKKNVKKEESDDYDNDETEGDEDMDMKDVEEEKIVKEEPSIDTTTASSSRTRKRSPRKRKAVTYDEEDDNYNDDDDFEPSKKMDSEDDDDDKVEFDDDEEEEVKPKSSRKTKSSSPSKKKSKTSTTTSKTTSKTKAKDTKPKSKKKPATKKAPKPPPIKPTKGIPSYPIDKATPECLLDIKFVFTGNMKVTPRETLEEYVKSLGGSVTTAVSSRTNYLIVGDEELLDDGRSVTDTSKYKKAVELGESKVAILTGEEMFYGLVKLLDDKRKEEAEGGSTEDNMAVKQESTNTTASASIKNPYTKSVSASAPNTTTKQPVKNPYKKVQNPYAKKKIATKQEEDESKQKENSKRFNKANEPNALWADKYAPRSTAEILGNQKAVRVLKEWLGQWEDTFNAPTSSNSKGKGKKKSGVFRAALLSGPPGIGKSTTAALVAEESGRDVVELNASDTRSKKSLERDLGDVTGSHVISFGPQGGGVKKENKKAGATAPTQKKRCIIMDEVDGMGAGDRSGMAELIKMIKASKVPIICICNDRQNQKIRSLAPHCLDLKYIRPVKSVIARRALYVGEQEGMVVERNAAEAISESCGNDIRQVLNCLQMWSNKNQDVTYRGVKERERSINKDEILRISMFDATKLIVQGRCGLKSSNVDRQAELASLNKRTDAFFVDYSLMGLNVQQNYLKVMVPSFQKFKAATDIDAGLEKLEDMANAASCMSDFSLVEDSVRGGDQNWGLLPLCSILVVQAGFYAGGANGSIFPGFPEFAAFLGKNSSLTRKRRLLQELSHHMNYKISADSAELRLQYIPVLRDRFLSMMMPSDGPQVDELIEVMDEYGLDRDDIFENLDEFTLDSQAKKFSDLDSKIKAGFTREYNKGIHKSQALVEELVVKKRKRSTNMDDTNTQDTEGNGDDQDSSSSDRDDDEDVEALQKLFAKKKGSKGKKNAKTRKGKSSR